MPVAAAHLPALNASLNSLSTILLLTGYLCIRRRRIAAHRTCMLAAFCSSSLFLASYLIYHYLAGSTPFTHQGWIRGLYFTLLLSHTLLAATVPFLALATLWLALSARFVQHRAIARWTLPIWLYVSATGVLIYWMLYQL